MSTIDKTRPSAENLQQRLDFEWMISDISSKFINLRPGEVDGEIEDALRRACEQPLLEYADAAVPMQTPAHRDYIRKRLPPHMAAHTDREISPWRRGGAAIARLSLWTRGNLTRIGLPP